MRSVDFFKGKNSLFVSFKYIFFVLFINCIGRCVFKVFVEFYFIDDGCGVVWRNFLS